MSDGIRITGNGTTEVGGISVNTPYESEDSKGIKVEDFLNLMVAQLSNQDFMNPVDDTQYMAQLAQFATMQSMQELTHYSQNNYVMGLVGKTVTAASYGVGGSVNKETGVVTKVTLADDTYTLTVNGKNYSLSQIMTINDGASTSDKNDLEAAKNMPLISQSVTEKSFDFRWYAPMENTEDEDYGLVYDVYYTTNSGLDFNTLEGVKSGTKAAKDLTDTKYVLEGLDPNTTYFVNVVVRNPNGDEAVYQRSIVTTKES